MSGPGGRSIRSGPPLGEALGDATLGDFLIELAASHGSRPALVTPGGRWSYEDLLAAATDVARGLLARGAGPGSRVGVLLPNGFEWVAAAYGAALIGAVPVLLNVFSSAPEQEQALTLTSTSVLVMAATVGRHRLLDDLAARNPKLLPGPDHSDEDRLPSVASVFAVGQDAVAGGLLGTWADLVAAGAGVAAAEVGRARAQVRADDDALIMFTSGTSGTPKAVVHGHRAPRLQPPLWAGVQRMRTGERVFSSYPFCWSSGFARSLGATWTVGGCMVTLDHFEPGVALRLMADNRTTMAILPGAGHLDLRLVEHPDFATTDLSCLERPSNPILARALGLGEGFRGAGYGLTETFTLVTASPAGTDDNPPGSCGRPLPGWTVKVVDPDTGEVLPSGETGQIKVRGPAVMKRYEGRPPGFGFDADGFFETPDLGLMDDDGYLFFASRMDDVVRSAGVNVSTSELERELAQMDGVRLAVVVGIPHPTLDQALVACVVPRDERLQATDVTGWLRPRIASYKLPRAVLLIDEADLRFTVSQKVQLADLRELAAKRVADLGLW
jgi:acyl-CoA synthetase (AMP-forming)/AMP-acid ligase II